MNSELHELKIPMEMINTMLLIFGPPALVGIWSLITMWFKIQAINAKISMAEIKSAEVEKKLAENHSFQSNETKEIMRNVHVIQTQVATVQALLKIIIDRNIHLDSKTHEDH